MLQLLFQNFMKFEFSFHTIKKCEITVKHKPLNLAILKALTLNDNID